MLAVQWFALAALFGGRWLGWQLLRQNGRILLRLGELENRLDRLEFGDTNEPAGLPIGSAAPDFELPDLAGKHHSLAEYRCQPLLLVFFNPACGFCQELAPKLAALSPSLPPGERAGERSPPDSKPLILIISTGDVDANRLFNNNQIAFPVLLQKKMEIAAAYKANGTPSGYLINSDGKIASELAIGGEALLVLLGSGTKRQNSVGNDVGSVSKDGDQSLLTSAPTDNGGDRADRFKNHSVARSKLKRDGLKAGTPAPDFSLPRLDGREDLSLNELRGREVLLVFSSPHCGPCNTLAPELQKFHREHPELQVIMISRGEPKENRAKVKEHGLTFPVVLQQQWEISRLYAMFATPVAYLIDEAGIITTDVAVGTDAVLGLLTGVDSRTMEQRMVSRG